MSTVDDAIEAGARALSTHWRDMHTGGSLDRQRDLAGHASRAQWPILSAPMRELHVEREWRPLDGTYLGGTVCDHCRRGWPCAPMQAIYAIVGEFREDDRWFTCMSCGDHTMGDYWEAAVIRGGAGEQADQ